MKWMQCLDIACGMQAKIAFCPAPLQVQHRVLAARDPDGAQPLYWGATEEGRLMLGSELADLAACDPTATSFPAGTMFASEHTPLACSPGEKGWVIEGVRAILITYLLA